MSKINRKKLRELIKEQGLKDMADVNQFIKDLLSETIQEMLEAELDSELGYSKYDYKNKETTNSRNGYSKKTLKSSHGEFDVNIPRDRYGEFEPQLVKKHQKDISGIEDKILAMYAKGMSTRDIEKTIDDIYGIEISDSTISRITDKILPLITEWQNRPLAKVYAVVFLDAIHCSVRQDGVVTKKAAYTAIGIDLEGKRDVLGIWLGATESSKYWLGVVNELKTRGVEDILIACVDGLNGFPEAIRAVYPKVEIQRCIIHQIRNSTRYISYKDKKAFMTDLKPVYKAVTEEQALLALDTLEDKWGKKYPLAIKSWRVNWPELSTFFKYPPEIRKMIYTTNCIENYNRQLRKVTKTKSAFPSDEALMKILYLATMDIVDKWTMRKKDWGAVLNQLIIYFEDRVDIRI
jgi:transposase-like protein